MASRRACKSVSQVPQYKGEQADNKKPGKNRVFRTLRYRAVLCFGGGGGI